MEAKETVMKRNAFEGYTFGDRVWEMVEKFLEPQAEISFKAGEDKGYAHARQHCEDVIIPQAEAESKREVVEFVEERRLKGENSFSKSFLQQGDAAIYNDQWQAQKKKWGIKEN